MEKQNWNLPWLMQFNTSPKPAFVELLHLVCAVVSAQCTYHRPYGRDSAFCTPSSSIISPSFIAVTHNADELKTFLNRTQKYLAVYCMTVLFATWHLSLMYCFTLVINFKTHLSFIGFRSETDALNHFEKHPTLQIFLLTFKDLPFSLQSRWLRNYHLLFHEIEPC